MSKYTNLTLDLASRDGEVWEASFSDVERVLGTPMPESARKHRAWWANDGYAQSAAWLAAGWKTTNVDMANEKVTFVYTGGKPDRLAPVQRLTIAEAKAGLAANFNVPIDAIEIVVRG